MNEQASSSSTTEGRASGSGSGRILTFQTARKRSKSSLAIYLEQPAEQASTSDSGITSSSANNSSSRPIGQLPLSSFLQTDGSRLRTPMQLNNAAGSSSTARAGALWKVGNVMWERAADWAVVVVALIVLAASEKEPPRASYVPKAVLSDTNYPLLPNSVPAWSVPLYSLVGPAILMALHSAVLRRPMGEAHHLILGLFTAVMVTGAITNLIKPPVGRLRPDFNARCWPDGAMVWEKEDALGGWPKCTASSHDSIDEGRKSFPSGHSSWSAAGLCYCTWLLLDRLHVFGAAGAGHPWRLLLACMPALAALAVGISRVTDYWHHPTDVAAGLLLGCFVSWLCYRQQRVRLAAEVDPVSYGGAVAGQAGGGGAGYASGSMRFDEDGMPLLQQQGVLLV
uniref:Phosphatidic acid phosphatase type 2/haloperoxidase domain-containing protein n=1 Tax=Tetradesmus obliquus TaxID=3088 RepID=A0A383VZN4_TETOB|eukprot:jgi/Sobl393_1/12705/SZX70681.1